MLRPVWLLLLIAACCAAGCSAPGLAGVRVEWSTESEMNTAGFNLYRGESPDGPFTVRVNEQLIPASPDPLAGGRYRFVDRTARPGVTYYYQLEEVERDGAVNRYGPIRVRAGGFDWRHGIVLSALGVIVLALWVWGGRPRGGPESSSTKGAAD